MIGEVALSSALLVAAGLMIRGAVANLRTDGEYETRTLLTGRYDLREESHTPEEVDAFHEDLVEALEGRPGVGRVALASHLPGVFSPYRQFELEGGRYERPEDRPRTHVVFVSPGSFAALGSRVLRGRDLTWRDGREEPPAVVVNEAFVGRWLAGRDPIGARLRLTPEDPWATIVGVVPALGLDVGRDVDASGIYLPFTAATQRRMAFLARAAGGTDPLSLVAEARAAVGRLDPELPLYEVATLAEHVRRTRVAEAGFAVLFLSFGVVGVLLAAVGLYGLLAFTVRRRTRELGVRVALGAPPGRVAWLAVRGGALQLGGGLLAGALLAALVSPFLGEALLGTHPRDPLVYASVTAGAPRRRRRRGALAPERVTGARRRRAARAPAAPGTS